MLTFFAQNSQPLNTLINALMLCVWVLYFQLLLNSHRRQKRAHILINRTAGHNLNAKCIVSNMSAEPIYIESVVIQPMPSGDKGVCSLTELESLTDEPDDDPRRFWMQGPLQRGEYITLGRFSDLVGLAVRDGADPPDQDADLSKIDSFKIMIIAAYGPDRGPVAAERQFTRASEGSRWTWEAAHARQIRWFWERWKLRKYLGETA